MERYNWFNVAQGFGRRHKNLGGSLGYMMKFSLGRTSLRLGYRLKYNCTVIKLNHYTDLSSLEDLTSKYLATIYTQLFQHQYPVALTFNLRRENDAPYLLMGVEPGYVFGKIETEDWTNGIFTDRIKVPFLQNHLYNEHPYVFLNMGYGFRKEGFEFDFIFKYRVDQYRQSLTMTEYILDFNLTYFFKGNTISKKPFIFSDEN
jgi:hypothetical protein